MKSNLRIVKHNYSYSIRRVFYDDKGHAVGVSSREEVLNDDSLHDLFERCAEIDQAFKNKPLEYDKLKELP